MVRACLGRHCFRWGFRLVQALPSSPPSSGLGLLPSASAFSFPLPFQGSARSGLGVLVLVLSLGSSSSFCAFPVLCSCEVTFTSFSFSLHFHLPFILIFTSSSGTSVCDPAWRGVCVCVEHLNRCKTSTVFHLQGARGRIDGTGQRRPIYVVVRTYLLFS